MHQIDNGIKENFFRWDGRLNRLRFLKRIPETLWSRTVLQPAQHFPNLQRKRPFFGRVEKKAVENFEE